METDIPHGSCFNILSFPAIPLQGTTLNNTSCWSYCGPLLPLSPDKLPHSFHEWAKATVNGPLAPSLLRFLFSAHESLATLGFEYYWITIRATKPTHEYDLPRWHTDDYAQETQQRAEGYNGLGRMTWKLCTTLLGPGTLFIEDGLRAREVQHTVKKEIREAPVSEHICTSIKCLGCNATSETVRRRLATALEAHRIVQTGIGEYALFRAGPVEGAVHSEPPHDTDRIFVNIVPGTKEELTGLMSRWGMEFPRAWSIGVPGHHAVN